MSLLKKIFSSGASELTESIGKVVDNIVTNDEEKLQAKTELVTLVENKLTELAGYQKEVLTTELQGNWLQRSWRPILMLTFGFIVAYSKFLAPALGLPNAILEDQFWTLLEIGIGGYVIGRSVEKISDRVTKNLDVTFLKKKERKLK